jgi:hypothetical protein
VVCKDPGWPSTCPQNFCLFLSLATWPFQKETSSSLPPTYSQEVHSSVRFVATQELHTSDSLVATKTFSPRQGPLTPLYRFDDLLLDFSCPCIVSVILFVVGNEVFPCDKADSCDSVMRTSEEFDSLTSMWLLHICLKMPLGGWGDMIALRLLCRDLNHG